MREILISDECYHFIEQQPNRVALKFYQLIEVISEIKIVHSNFVKKLVNSEYYELRIKAGNEIRILIITIDHYNFNECEKLVCLNGFVKKSNKDYKKAIMVADVIKNKYLEEE
jgi:hypothetical protein